MEDTHQICRRKNGNWRCKNVSGDNKLQYCDKHYKNKKEIEEKKKLPSVEQFCCRTGGGGWRCKNLRMSHGALADDDIVPKTNRCEKHYNYYVNYHKNLKEKKRNGDGEETRDSKRRKKVTEEGDETEIQNLRTTGYNDTSDIQSGSANIGTKRENVKRTEESGELDSTDFLTNNPPLITSNKMMKKKKEMEKKLPPDEQRCGVKGGGLAGGGRWRCKNFRMGYGASDDAVPKTRYCEKHYIRRENIKKRFREGKVAGRGHIEETRGADRRTENQNAGDTSDDTSVTIVEGGTGNIRRKMKIVERTEGSGEPESSAKTREPLVEFESMETYKRNCFELSLELEKKKVECTKIQGELAEVVETKKTKATDEAEQTSTDAAERWRKMFSDLEGQVWGMENKNSAIPECVDSRFSSLEILVLRSVKDSSILRSGEIERDETTSGGRDYSQYQLKPKEKEVLNMYENLE